MWKEFIRRHSYQSKVAPNREGARLIIRRLQKTVLRILRDPDFKMSKTSFQQKPTEPEPPVDGTQFSAHRNSKQDSNCRTCNDFKSWSKQQRLISNTQAAKVNRNHCAFEKCSWHFVYAFLNYYLHLMSGKAYGKREANCERSRPRSAPRRLSTG